MFGYVRAASSLLSREDQTRYEAVYCGLCQTMGDRYGWTARLILNYDFVFLAILLAQPAEEGEFPSCSCPVYPWRKRRCWRRSQALAVAADESIILTWWKLRDTIRDGNFLQKLGAGAVCLVLRGHYRKAAARCPAFDETTRDCLEELHRLEEANCPSLDRPADTFARILQAAAPELQPPARSRGIGQILYHVGRWIYLADAWDDLERDRKNGSYNPVLARFGTDAAQSKNHLRETMHVSLGLSDTAFSLLDWGEWETLLRHILGTGLPAVEEAVFTGQWKKKSKQKRKETGL